MPEHNGNPQPTARQLRLIYEQQAAYAAGKLDEYQRMSAQADAKYLEYVHATWDRDAAYAKWQKTSEWGRDAVSPTEMAPGRVV